MGGNDFAEAVKAKADVGVGYLVVKTKGLGSHEMVTVQFINVPEEAGRGGGGAVAMNNRLLLFVDGFGREENAPPPTGKVKMRVGAAEVLGLGGGKRPRGKTGTPEKMVDYVAGIIGQVSKLEPRLG